MIKIVRRSLILMCCLLIELTGCGNTSNFDKIVQKDKVEIGDIQESKSNTKSIEDNVDSEEVKISESINETNEELDVYSGPGTEYVILGSINKDDIKKVVKIEKEWVEIEFSKKRGYIKKEIVPELCTDQIPRVTYRIDQNVQPYPVIYYINIQLSLFDDAKVCYMPTGASFDQVNTGETVTILCTEEFNFRRYAQIEISTNGKKQRCYSEIVDLFSLDNPLLNFNSVKNTNAIITYEEVDYYSSSGETTALSSGWHKKAEKSISKTEWDILAGITNVISSNDINNESIKSTEGKIQLYSFKDRQYINANIKNERKANSADILDFFLGSAISFLEGATNTVNLKVELDEYCGEHKIVIKTGVPIESPYAGKTTTLSSLIVQKNNTPLTALESSKRADEMIKSMYPDLDKNKKYDMEMVFSKDFEGNNFGYYLVIDKNLNIYAVPIIHNGTSFMIYSKGEFICEATWDFATSMIQVNDESATKILELLSENGFNIKGFVSLPYDATEYNGHHYFVYSDICNSWEDAKSYCESIGGYLAIINDDAENTFLFDLMRETGHKNAYFGLSDCETEGIWKCVDGSNPEYVNWSNGEPNNERGVEHYAMFYYKSPEYQWNDGDFNHGTTNDNATFFCEWNY